MGGAAGHSHGRSEVSLVHGGKDMASAKAALVHGGWDATVPLSMAGHRQEKWPRRDGRVGDTGQD